MLRFLRRLFRFNSNNNQQQEKSFFLDPDEAKTYGDIDFMRTSIRMKKSFPKTLSNPQGQELVEEVSALEKKEISEVNPAGEGNNTNSGAQISSQQTTPRPSNFSTQQNPQFRGSRQSDSSMDRFRDMARDIKKK